MILPTHSVPGTVYILLPSWRCFPGDCRMECEPLSQQGARYWRPHGRHEANGRKSAAVYPFRSGSEYDAEDYMMIAKAYGITISMSDKHSPWQNAFQESFVRIFKVDLGRSRTVSNVTGVHKRRFISKLRTTTRANPYGVKTTPQQFRTRWEITIKELRTRRLENRVLDNHQSGGIR